MLDFNKYAETIAAVMNRRDNMSPSRKAEYDAHQRTLRIELKWLLIEVTKADHGVYCEYHNNTYYVDKSNRNLNWILGTNIPAHNDMCVLASWIQWHAIDSRRVSHMYLPL